MLACSGASHAPHTRPPSRHIIPAAFVGHRLEKIIHSPGALASYLAFVARPEQVLVLGVVSARLGLGCSGLGWAGLG